MGFSRQEYWSGLLCPPPEDLPDPGIEPASPTLQVDSLPLSHEGSPHVPQFALFHSLSSVIKDLQSTCPCRARSKRSLKL